MGVSSKGTSRSHSPRIEPQNQNNYSYKRQELRDREKNTKEHIQTLPQKPLYKAPQPPQQKNILGSTIFSNSARDQLSFEKEKQARLKKEKSLTIPYILPNSINTSVSKGFFAPLQSKRRGKKFNPITGRYDSVEIDESVFNPITGRYKAPTESNFVYKF